MKNEKKSKNVITLTNKYQNRKKNILKRSYGEKPPKKN